MGGVMLRFWIAILAVLFATALTQIASAADLPRKALPTPPPTPVYNWTGFYVGGNVGGAWKSRDVDYSANDPLAVLLLGDDRVRPLPTSFDSSGIIGGVQIGYNWQFSRNWLVGFETDFDWSGVKGSASITNTDPGGVSTTTHVDEHIKWFGTVRVRLGYLPLDTLLLYVTGGFAYGKVEHTGNYVNDGTIQITGLPTGGFSLTCIPGPGAVCFTGSSSDVATGWTVGGGIEYALWQNWRVKAEYLYISLESQSVTETALRFAAGTSPASFNANFGRINLNLARAGLSYRF